MRESAHQENIIELKNNEDNFILDLAVRKLEGWRIIHTGDIFMFNGTEYTYLGKDVKTQDTYIMYVAHKNNTHVAYISVIEPEITYIEDKNA